MTTPDESWMDARIESGHDKCVLRAHQSLFQTIPFANTASRSRCVFRASLARNVLPFPKEGAGNAGRPMRPQPGRAEKQAMPVVTVTTVTPEKPGIPRAMVLRFPFVFSPVTGL